MEVKLFLNKDIHENANLYFNKAKKLKAKLPGIEKAVDNVRIEIENFEKKKESYLIEKEKEQKLKIHKKKEWYEKFRYTFTKNGFLCVIGKDSGTNEILIKKHSEENDLILHTETPGSPFGIIKNGRDKASSEDILEAGQFLSCFSKQWKSGFGTADAFWVYHEQLSKQPQSGEYMSKGSFMVRGKKNILKNIQLRICLGVKTSYITCEDSEEKIEYNELFSGSDNACRKYCGQRYIKLEPGSSNYKALTKEIKKRLGFNDIVDLPKFIPNDSKILKK